MIDNHETNRLASELEIVDVVGLGKNAQGDIVMVTDRREKTIKVVGESGELNGNSY